MGEDKRAAEVADQRALAALLRHALQRSLPGRPWSVAINASTTMPWRITNADDMTIAEVPTVQAGDLICQAINALPTLIAALEEVDVSLGADVGKVEPHAGSDREMKARRLADPAHHQLVHERFEQRIDAQRENLHATRQQVSARNSEFATAIQELQKRVKKLEDERRMLTLQSARKRIGEWVLRVNTRGEERRVCIFDVGTSQVFVNDNGKIDSAHIDDLRIDTDPEIPF